MIHAYQEIYLSKAQSLLGEAFDYVINGCGIPGDDFVKMFIVSSLSERAGKGDPAIVAGKSGIELAVDIVLETTGKEPEKRVTERYGRSSEYWIGWAVAYYQWWSGRKYGDIFKAVSFADLKNMYYPLHEADISKFADIMDVRIKELFPETNLKRIRSLYGCSQAELAKKSGVSLRSIQMYEQRNKDINKANAGNVYRIAKALGCTMEDLLEAGNVDNDAADHRTESFIICETSV